MEAQTLGSIDLDSIIYDYLGASEQPEHKYKKIFDIAYRGMDHLGLDFFYKIKSVLLPVLGNRTVQLPGDCLQWTKIGYFDRGQVIAFGYNNRQSSFAGLQSNRLASSLSGQLFSNYDGVACAFYNYCGDILYGVGCESYEGAFSIADGFILLDPAFGWTNICLEYVSNPGAAEGTYYIPVQFREAMLAWIAWQDIQFLAPSRRGTVGDKRERERVYYNFRRLALAQYKPFRLEQMYPMCPPFFIGRGDAGNNLQTPSPLTTTPIVTPDLSNYQTFINESVVVIHSKYASVEESQAEWIDLDATNEPIVYTLDPALLAGRTLHIRCKNDTNGVTVNTPNDEIFEMLNGTNQTEVQLLFRAILQVRSNGTKLIEVT